MALTRVQVDQILRERAGPLLEAAGLAIAPAASYCDFDDFISMALFDMGYTVASILVVVDSDLAQVPAGSYSEFLLLTEYHMLENIMGNLDDVDITQGPRSEKFSQLATQVERKIARIERKLEKTYGYGMATPDAGYITLTIAEHI